MNNSEYTVIILAAGYSKRMQEMTKEKPKSFLEIEKKKIIEYHLDILNQRGFKDVIIVVGYLNGLFMKSIGTKYGNLNINYQLSKEYSTTGHGWSIYLTKEKWEIEKNPVLLIHADIFYNPKILDLILASAYSDIVGAHDQFQIHTGDECMVRGDNGIIESIKFDSKNDPSIIIGEVIGLNKWSSELMENFYLHMEHFFETDGRSYNYEVILNDLIQKKPQKINYILSNGLDWININYKEDYYKAKNELFQNIYGQ